MMQSARGVAAVAVCLAGALAGCGGGGGDVQEPARELTSVETPALDPALARNLPPNATKESAEKGRDLYITCAPCHGLDARGTRLGPSLRDQEWIRGSGSYEEIQQVIRDGVPETKNFPVPMPAGGGGAPGDEQVRALATYVYALSRPAAPAAPTPP
jgi:mono/diheme cytochrome c family protein